MELINLTNGEVLADDVKVANSFWTRFKGLMLTKDLPKGCALLIEPCQSVHTYFMNYDIDILFVNEAGLIVAMEEQMKPRKIGKLVRHAKAVVELPSGTIQRARTQVNHVIKFN